MNMGVFIAACKKVQQTRTLPLLEGQRPEQKRVKTTQEKGCQGLDKVQTEIVCTAAEPNLGVCTFLHAALESSIGERLFHALLNL